MGAYGLHATHPVDNPHIIAMAAARTVETDLVLDIRNGPDAADRILGIQKDGEIWAQDGSATDPTYTFEDDIDSGWYRIGANNVGLALGGSKVVDYGTGGVAITGTLSSSGAATLASLAVTAATTLNGDTTIGNATGDALTFHPSAWTLTNAVTITGTWTDLGIVTTADINGGTVDGAVIGGASAAAGSFTTLTASSIVRVDDATDSTSITTGSLQTDGGLGVVKAAWIGGLMNVAGAVTMQSTLGVTGATTLTGDLQGATANGYLHMLGDSGASVGLRLTDAGLLALGDTTNANMTVGLTINQGANDDEILALKSSDVAHGVTTIAETDTFGFMSKSGAQGGIQVAALRADTAGVATRLRSIGGLQNTAKTTSAFGSFLLDAAVASGTGVADVGADVNMVVFRNNSTTRFIFDAEGTMHSVGATATDQIGNGLWFINDTSNANMTLGLTINQGANDDHILTFKSSDVATGLTSAASDTVETDDYGAFTKIWPDLGGLRIQSLMEDAAGATAFALHSFGGTASTDKTTAAAFGLVDIRVHEHDGANGLANITADGNVLSVSARVGGAIAVRLLVDEDGDLYSVTAAQTFDREDDLALVRALDLVRGDDVVRQEWDDFVRYNEADLIRLGILGAPVSEGGMTNVTQLQRLHNGALVQLHTAQRKTQSRTEKLEGVLRDLLALNPSLEGRDQALALLEA